MRGGASGRAVPDHAGERGWDLATGRLRHRCGRPAWRVRRSAALTRLGRVLALVAAATAAGGAAGDVQAAQRRFFSFDPADETTRTAAGALTSEFDQHLVSTHVIAIRATEGEATADLQRVGEGSLGAGGLDRAVGAHTENRDLYRIKADKDGGAMITALCPGADQ